MGNGYSKEMMCISHGHELKWRNDGGRQVQGRGEWRGEKNGTNVIA